MKLRKTAIALGVGAATFSALSLLKVNKEAVIGATFVSGSAAFYFSKKKGKNLVGMNTNNKFSFYLRKASEALGEYEKEQEVINYANKALEIEENSDAYYFLGFAKSDIGENKEALEDLNKAIELNSNESRYFYVRGNVKENLRDYKGAIADFKTTVEIEPTHINAWGNLALAQKQIGNYDQAISSLDRALEIDPKHSNNYRMRGNIKYEIKDFEEALKDFDKALEIPSQVADEKAWREGVHADAYFNRGWAKFELNDKEGACNDWNTAYQFGNSKAKKAIDRYCLSNDDTSSSREFTEEDVENLQNLVGGADEYNKMMQWCQANISEEEIAEFDEVIESGNIELSKKVILELRRKYDQRKATKSELEDQIVIDDCTKALELDPTNDELYLKRATAKFRLEDEEECISDIKKVLEINPRSKEAYRLLGIIKTGDDDLGAIECFNNYVDLDNRNAYIYYLRGVCYSNLEKDYYAIMDFNLFIEKTGESNIKPYLLSYTLYKRALSKYRLNDNQGALDDFDRAIEIDPREDFIKHYIKHKEEIDFESCFKFQRVERLTEILAPWGVLRDELIVSARLGYDLAINRLKSGYEKIDKLIDTQTEKIDQEPQSTEHLIQRGLLKEQYDPKDAINDYLKALEINPKLSNVYRYCGLLRQVTGDILGAIDDYRKAIEIDPEGENIDPYNKEKNLIVDLLNEWVDEYTTLKYERVIYPRELLGELLRDRNEIALNGYIDYFCRANSRYNSRHYLGALYDYSKAIELNKKNEDLASLYVNRANCKDLIGDPNSAIDDYSKALEIDPTHCDAYYNRGVARRNSGDEVGALSDFEKTIELNPSFTNALQNIGSIKFRSSDLKSACSYWKKSSELGNYNADQLIDQECGSEGVLASAEFYKNRAKSKLSVDDDYEGAKDDFLKSIEEDPNDAETYFGLGNVYDSLNDEENAVKCWGKSIELDPSKPDSYFNRGLTVYFNDSESSINDFEKVLEIEPDNASALACIGDIYAEDLEYSKAIKYLDKAIELDDSIHKAYSRRAECRRESNDFKGALSDTYKAYEIDPEAVFPSLMIDAASDHYQLGEYQKAIELLNEEIDDSSDHPDVDLYKQRGRYKKAAGDLEGANFDLMIAYKEVDKKITESDEFKEFEIVNRAEIKELLDDFNGALSDYNQLLEFGVWKRFYLCKSGKCKKVLGDFKGACEDWKKAAELGDEDAAKLLEEHCE